MESKRPAAPASAIARLNVIEIHRGPLMPIDYAISESWDAALNFRPSWVLFIKKPTHRIKKLAERMIDICCFEIVSVTIVILPELIKAGPI